MPKRILFIYYQNLKPGGVARVMINLANELCENGYDISILFLMEGENTFYEINPKIKIHTVDSFGHWGVNKVNPLLDKYLKKFRHRYSLKKYVYDFGQWDILNKWLKKNHQNYDAIISSWYKLSSQIAVNKEIAKKTLAWEHSNYEVGGKIWGDFLRPKYKNLAGIVCINKASVDYYKSLNPNTFLIPNLIGEPFESIDKIDFHSKKNNLIYVGRLDEDKNVSNIIDAISKIDLKDFYFKIIGDGPELENLKKLAEDKNLQSKIIFAGQLPINQIKNELLDSKIFLFMSKTEALGMVLLEAMFCGNSLISYNCKHGPSDIVNDKNGFLIPMNDKMLFQKKLKDLIDNIDQLNQLNMSAFEDSKHWKKENTLKKWMSLLTAK
ncbi:MULTISPECIES: glycosyltransferase [Chryseobacterium]|uniref:glycosyltransferase n=1 Tax=Chryseobacterium TaxID=59732 RepID=UPI000C9DB1D2|nr:MULTISPECIES: glycosyltransferase [Chryseobacterium]VXC28158.1 Glycosyltransferase involved in cell wall bisynthesis [Chryseobacterium sp. 8AT]